MKIGSCTDCKRGYQKITEISGLCEQCFRKRNNREKLDFLPKKKCICSPNCNTMIADNGDNKFAYGHHQRGEYNSRYKGGRYIDSYGYVKVKAPDHPYSDSKGYVLEHRLIMEQYLGRYLTRDELVHHIDENKHNNKIENLQLITRSAHQNHHNPRKDFRKDMNGIICIECGSDTTYLSKNGQPHWMYHPISNMSYVCEKCYKRIKSQMQDKVSYRRKKEISDRICLKCGAGTSESSSGQSTWKSYKKGWICKRCYDKQLRDKKKQLKQAQAPR